MVPVKNPPFSNATPATHEECASGVRPADAGIPITRNAGTPAGAVNVYSANASAVPSVIQAPLFCTNIWYWFAPPMGGTNTDLKLGLPEPMRYSKPITDSSIAGSALITGVSLGTGVLNLSTPFDCD